jgi:preprotein translocase subunit SecG
VLLCCLSPLGAAAREDDRREATSVLTIIVIVIHIAVSLALIGMVLLHSGKGGGLSDMFGGGLGQSAAGSTVAERNLDRATIACAVCFMFTTIILVIRLSSGTG